METCKHGDVETWKRGNMETTKNRGNSGNEKTKETKR